MSNWGGTSILQLLQVGLQSSLIRGIQLGLLIGCRMITARDGPLMVGLCQGGIMGLIASGIRDDQHMGASLGR